MVVMMSEKFEQNLKQGKLPLALNILNPTRLRSFVTRQGRMTQAQRAAIETQWPHYGLAVDDAEAWSSLWQGPQKGLDDQQVVLEIGFGNGKSLIDMACAEPDTLFIGVEVHQPGIGALLIGVTEQALTNIRVCCADARDILVNQVPNASLERVQVFFPDPWPKKRHHKRRIIQPEFVQLVAQKLKPGGRLHCATDWQPYAEHILATLSEAEGFQNLYQDTQYAPRPDYRPLTKFETRGKKLGHGVWDIIFQTQSNNAVS